MRQSSISHLLLLVLTTCALIMVPSLSQAQGNTTQPNTTQPAPAEQVSPEVKQLQDLLAQDGLTAAEQTELETILAKIKEWQQATAQQIAQKDAFINDAARAATRIEEINQRLANPPADEIPEGVGTLGADELEQRFDQERLTAADANAKLTAAEQSLAAIEANEGTLSAQVEQAQTAFQGVAEGEIVASKGTDTERVRSARTVALGVKTTFAQTQLERLQAQQQTLPDRKSLKQAEIENFKAELARHQRQRDAWKALFDEHWPKLLVDKLSIDWVQERIDRILGAKNEETGAWQGGSDRLSAADKDTAKKVYDKALARLRETADENNRREAFTQEAAAAPVQIAELQKEMKADAQDVRKTPASLVENRLNEARNELQTLLGSAATEDGEESLKGEIQSAQEVVDAFQANQDKAFQERSRAEAKDPPVDAEMEVKAEDQEQVRRAKIIQRKTHERLLAARAARATVQIDTIGVRKELAELRLQRLKTRANLLQSEIDWLEEQQENLKQNNAVYQAQEAERQVRKLEERGAHPLVLEIARRNVELAYMRVGTPDDADEDAEETVVADDIGLLGRTREYRDAFEEANRLSENLENEFKSTRDMVEKVGLTNAVGKELRRRRSSLPDTRDLKRDLARRASEAEVLQLDRLSIDTDDQKLDVGVTPRADELVEQAQAPTTDEEGKVTPGKKLSEGERAELRLMLIEVLNEQQRFIDMLKQEYDEFFVLLGDLDKAERDLIAQVADYQAYIDERVLWIRSTEPFGLKDFTNLGVSLVWFFDPTHWGQLFQAIGDDVTNSPIIFALCVILVSVVFVLRRFAHHRIDKVSKIVANNTGAPVRMTLWAALSTLILAAPVSLAMALLAWRLQAALTGFEFVRAISQGLMAASATLFTIHFLRRVCRPSGLGESHFKWNANMMKRLRTRLFALATFLPAATGVMVTLNTQSDEALAASLGRVAFVVGALSLAWFMWGVFKPKTGALLAHRDADDFERWRNRVYLARFIGVVVLPVTFSVLALVGFYYTATELDMRFRATAALVIFLVVIDHLLARSFMVAVARFAARALRRQKQAAQTRKMVANPEGGESIIHAPEPEQEISGEAVMRQLQALRRAIVIATSVIAVVLIWGAVLPAFSFLDRVELWEYAAGPEGKEILKTVTLLGLMKAVGMLILTVIGARSLPGLLEATVLERLRLESGLRYAIRTLSRYAIYVTGVALSFGYLGMQWGDVQWLVAAFSVGLGFGLQEIFANFVSGLILLFERPMQVGDVVTVNGTTGSVTKINMRATTIRDWDYKEIVIPNKAFITGDLVNWSLSSNILRLVFSVGVAYGSDLKLVEKKLYEIAANHTDVLKDPAPMVVFHNFGDSTLDFVLRCYIPSINVYSKAQHELFVAINDTFNDANIEIAFPQRDINIRTQDAAFMIQQSQENA